MPAVLADFRSADGDAVRDAGAPATDRGKVSSSTPLFRRTLIVNCRQIDSWLWMARHNLRKKQAARACECMLSALWLMGVER